MKPQLMSATDPQQRSSWLLRAGSNGVVGYSVLAVTE